MLMELWIACQHPLTEPQSNRLIHAWQDWGSTEKDITIDRICIQNGRAHSRIHHIRDGIHSHWIKPWNSIIRSLREDILHSSADAILLVDRAIHSGPVLSQTLLEIMAKRAPGWWFSVSRLPYFAHNILVKSKNKVHRFEMEGVFTFDDRQYRYFNHISKRHFIHSQDAPIILRCDGGLAFVNLLRFKADNPMPFEFSGDNYFLEEKANDCPGH